MREHIYLFCLVAFKGQNQRGVCQRERVKCGCKVREVKREGWREMGGEEVGVLASFMGNLARLEVRGMGGFDEVWDGVKCVRGTSEVGSYSLLGGYLKKNLVK